MSLGRLYGKVKKKCKSLSRSISFPTKDNKLLKNGTISDKFSVATNHTFKFKVLLTVHCDIFVQ